MYFKLSKQSICGNLLSVLGCKRTTTTRGRVSELEPIFHSQLHTHEKHQQKNHVFVIHLIDHLLATQPEKGREKQGRVIESSKQTRRGQFLENFAVGLGLWYVRKPRSR